MTHVNRMRAEQENTTRGEIANFHNKTESMTSGKLMQCVICKLSFIFKYFLMTPQK